MGSEMCIRDRTFAVFLLAVSLLAVASLVIMPVVRLCLKLGLL